MNSPSGTRFYSWGLTQDLRPFGPAQGRLWAIICRPSGVVSHFPFRESFPLFLLIFLPLTFLSCRIKT